MRTPSRITTVISAGVLAAAGTAAVASAAGQNDRTCDGTGQRAGQQAGQGMRGQSTQAQRRGPQSRRGAQSRRGMRQGVRTLPKRTNTASLSATEAAAVTYMREEEKLARDVYATLASTSGNPVFARIASSEQRHMDALGRLITRYGLTDPAKNEAAGTFQNAELQRLYNELVAKGSASPAAAIEVGLSIERLDIADLNAREATTNHSDVRWVFEQLERGSNNHLRAFTRQAA